MSILKKIWNFYFPPTVEVKTIYERWNLMRCETAAPEQPCRTRRFIVHIYKDKAVRKGKDIHVGIMEENLEYVGWGKWDGRQYVLALVDMQGNSSSRSYGELPKEAIWYPTPHHVRYSRAETHQEREKRQFGELVKGV